MKSASPWLPWSGVFAVLLLLQGPLIGNPGYFSHDELQWWARANVSGWAALPWESWTDFGVFQYRPLTFNLWLALSYTLADWPYALHAAVVALGSVNAVLLGRCIEGAGVARRIAVVAAFVFVLTPYVAYTHGWVGTLADLLTLLMALLGLRLLQSMAHRSVGRDLVVATGVAALVAVALLCKESAVVVPAILLAAVYRHPRPRAVLTAVAIAALPVAIYLLLRLPLLLATPTGNESYAWALGHIPRRFAEYLLFPFLPPLFEVGPSLAKSPARLAAAAACVIALLAALATNGWRWPVAWLALFAALLAPVLILAISYGQYAYLASAATVGIAAAAWPQLRGAPRIALAFVTAVALAHGVTIQWRMRDIGIVQRTFYGDLVALLSTTSAPLRIVPADESDRWMIGRLLIGVPSYRGMPIAGRVSLVEPGETAALTMQRDGHLVASTR